MHSNFKKIRPSRDFWSIPTAFLEGTRYPLTYNFYSSKELAQFVSFPTIDTVGFLITGTVKFDVARAVQGNLKIGGIVKNEKDYKRLKKYKKALAFLEN